MKDKINTKLSRVERIEKILVEEFRCSVFRANCLANEILDSLDSMEEQNEATNSV